MANPIPIDGIQYVGATEITSGHEDHSGEVDWGGYFIADIDQLLQQPILNTTTLVTRRQYCILI